MPLHPDRFPTEYAWEMLNPTEKSAVGATQVEQIPLGRPGTIDELANLTIFAFSDACDYLTGETIAMDGGQRLAGTQHVRRAVGDDRRGLGARRVSAVRPHRRPPRPHAACSRRRSVSERKS